MTLAERQTLMFDMAGRALQGLLAAHAPEALSADTGQLSVVPAEGAANEFAMAAWEYAEAIVDIAERYTEAVDQVAKKNVLKTWAT